MPRLVIKSWPANPYALGGKSERRAIRYRAFIPDLIADKQFNLPSNIVTDVSNAERSIAALNLNPPNITNLEVLARRLLRAESLASSRIEGLVLSQRRLAKAEANESSNRDETAKSVLNNVCAMEKAIELGCESHTILLNDILLLHKILMLETTTPDIAGKLRDKQNWIGGNFYNPGRADYVPPPPEVVNELLYDLVIFINRTDLSPVVHTALIHAQFETIHPFADGNGRVGRALIHVALRRHGITNRYVPPVSLVLASDIKNYVIGLTAFREGSFVNWIQIFAKALHKAAIKASELSVKLAQLQELWRRRASYPRNKSSTDSLIEELPAYPIITLATAQKILNRSKQAVNEAITNLANCGVI
ncbi:MAG: Fic family protein, partial [Deltaproteobacteria bacterium]|nr:Fic family protein [Deltaproteobacteria bacterium]